MSLVWREQLSVGNDLIDSDHKHLIDIINQVEECMKTRSRDGLGSAFDRLSRYSKTHFAAEEKIAKSVGYKNASSLHDSHEALLARLDQLHQEIEDDWTDPSMEHFTELLRSWLIDHVIKEDLLMKPALTKRSPLFDPR
ncbi:MAG: bacteriohemerythrin [Sulfuritalea sp.]|nr:bacteriohemerythrin [Sulfuritalea sp.]